MDAKYAKQLKVFGEMCVVADANNKVGRSKIDPRGKISLFIGYITQHAGDVYRLLNPKTSRVIHSRDVKCIGKTWAEFYKIKMADRASGDVDPDECLQQVSECEDGPDPIQIIQPEVEDYESVASRRRSQTETVAARTWIRS